MDRLFHMRYIPQLINIYFFNAGLQQSNDDQGRLSRPGVPLPFNPFFSPPSFTLPIASAKKSYGSRIWRILTLFTHWNFLLVIKMMSCFQFLQNKKRKQAGAHPEMENEDLKELFSQPIVYEKFRDQILSYKIRDKNGTQFFHNHTLQTYLELKNPDPTIFDHITNDAQKELISVTASYEAIVDLYVQRFLNKHPRMNNENFLPSLKTTALGIALKISCDEQIYNSDFNPFLSLSWNPLLSSSFEISTHNKMEIEFLKEIDWNISTDELVADAET